MKYLIAFLFIMSGCGQGDQGLAGPPGVQGAPGERGQQGAKGLDNTYLSERVASLEETVDILAQEITDNDRKSKNKCRRKRK